MRISCVLAAGLLRRRGTLLLRTSALAAVTAVALGIASLVVALALMTGYTEALREGILAGTGHVIVLFPVPPPPAQRDELVAKLSGLHGVAAVGDAVYLPGLLTGGSARSEVVQLKAAEVPGTFACIAPSDRGPVGVAIGAELAEALGLVVGSRASLQVFVEPAGLRATPVLIDRVFDSGFAELDERWVIASLPELQARVTGIVPSAIEVFLVDPEDAEEFRGTVEALIPGGALVTTWQESNRGLFAALRWQKFSLALVLSLVVGVGAFEVASALVVLVTEKRRDIGILLALGGAPQLIREVLVFAGWAMGAVGVLAGLAGGLLVVLVMGLLGQPHFSPEIASIYMIDRIPFVVRGVDVGLVAIVGLVEVFVAALIPAARTASREPVEILRWV